jgi:DNA-binding response OmpR family regulator
MEFQLVQQPYRAGRGGKDMEAKRTVLVIDDTLLIRECLCYALEADGFEVFDCEDGLSALGAAAEKDFHIIITDYRMPNMNGVEVTKHLRLRFPAAIIIGVSSDDKRADFLAAGADAFLLKPYTYDSLITFLKAIK